MDWMEDKVPGLETFLGEELDAIRHCTFQHFPIVVTIVIRNTVS